jgi:hypothetical protein
VVRSYVKRLGIGGAEDGVVTCLVAGFSQLTADEQQIIIDTGMMPSASQQQAIDAAHPTLSDDIQRCFNTSVN